MTELKAIIYNRLAPLFGKECILVDAPYYPNIGDSLIWEGFEVLLKDNGIKCQYRSSLDTFSFPCLGNDTTIVFIGGGNFGDTWRELQDFRCNVIAHYPNNRIIILPQSVYYNNQNNLHEDISIFSSHKDLHICARDNFSYDFLRNNFKENNIILLPDLAFVLNAKNYICPAKESIGRVLYLVRKDNESVCYPEIQYGHRTDWPVISIDKEIRDNFTRKSRFRHKALRLVINHTPIISTLSYISISCIFLTRLLLIRDIIRKWQYTYLEFEYLAYLNIKYKDKVSAPLEWIMYHIHRPIVVRLGFNFVNKYDIVYSTRLHCGIIGYLLGKQVYLLDNSNHKVLHYYTTWFMGNNSILLYSPSITNNT